MQGFAQLYIQKSMSLSYQIKKESMIKIESMNDVDWTLSPLSV